MSTKTKILVDGNCIVCDLEVSHYKKIAPEEFEIVDISDPLFKAEQFGLTTEAVNKHLHVQTPDGEVKVGVEAFAHIWSRIPQYSLADKAIRLPLVNGIARIGYAGFAAVRPWLPKKK